MSADTANIVLKNCSLRWSSPLLFKDPFDVPKKILSDITSNEISQAAEKILIQNIKNPSGDTSLGSRIFRQHLDITTTSEIAQIIRMSEEYAVSYQPSDKAIQELRELWETNLRDARILCLTENHTNSAMWLHYADEFSGVVLEFQCITDSAFLKAKPVSYSQEEPMIYTAVGWANLLLSEKGTIEKYLEASLYSKKSEWNYEAEWRIASFKRHTETGLFSDYKFNPTELVAIYFGPNISNKNRLSLSSIADASYDVRLFNVEIGGKGQFNFHEL